MEVQARKFYSQRNMYLTGFTLFLSLILNRTYMMILDVLRLEEKVKVYGADISNADIEAITADGSPWVATAATDPANVGAVTVRAAYLKATDGTVDDAIEVPPALITQDVLREKAITTVPDLVKAFPDLSTPTIAAVK